MAVTLVTGKPGSYKSAFVLDIALSSDKSRPIFFCNFKDLNIEKLKSDGFDAHLMSDFSDWVDCPDGSLIFIDEIQEFTRNVSTKAKTEELPSHFTLLEKHRHRGIDIFVVTQHPMFIHTHLRRLLEKHIHMQRAIGLPYANKREWHNVCSEPEDVRNATIQNGCTVEVYRPNKLVFDYYTSTVLDTHKFKIPRKLITYAVLIFVGLSASAYFAQPFYKRFISSDESKSSNPTSTSPTSTSPDKNSTSLYSSATSNLKSDPNASLIFDPNNPSDYKPIDSRPPVDLPRVKGIIIWDGKCHAYSQQGSPMDISQSTCFKYFNERQFDYLKSPS